MATRDTTVPDTMRSVTCRGIRDYPHSPATPVPTPGAGEVLLRVERAGICAGDAKCHAGAPMFWGDATRAPYVQAPVTPGHEFAGHIAALGPGLGGGGRGGGGGDWAVGDRVTAEQVVACGECLYCRKALRWLCAPHDIFGFHTCVPGAMAEYMVLPAKALLHRVPHSLTPKEAVYIEPLRYVGLDGRVGRSGVLGHVSEICHSKLSGYVTCERIPGPLPRGDWRRHVAAGAREQRADFILHPGLPCPPIHHFVLGSLHGCCGSAARRRAPSPGISRHIAPVSTAAVCTRWSGAILSLVTRWWSVAAAPLAWAFFLWRRRSLPAG